MGDYKVIEEKSNEVVELVIENQRDPLLCIVHKLLLSLKQTSPNQRHSIFKTKCTINKKVCEVIIDSGSSENIISKSLVKAISLTTLKHPHPYFMG